MILQSDFELRNTSLRKHAKRYREKCWGVQFSSEVREETNMIPEVAYGPHSSRCFCLQTKHSLFICLPY